MTALPACREAKACDLPPYILSWITVPLGQVQLSGQEPLLPTSHSTFVIVRRTQQLIHDQTHYSSEIFHGQISHV